ncbi:MAG: F0F1 ATP synthase subunit delta [Cyanosarcina radialis HA8281-LM2]|jgi:F-type H+-transporting ATPase subunit delta|nr:F0F1 ATP synthase subunit delta [Cyanosarcina radialis HA8281-LM2]
MKGSVVSGEILEPYAEALMSVAQSQNLLDKFGEDVRALLGLLETSPDLEQFLGNPVVKPEAKKAVLQQVAGEQIHPYMVNFLKLLVDRRRILFLEGICQQFQVLLRQLNKTVLAEVTSAVELTDEQKNAIAAKVRELSSAERVELDTKIDPELIGGVIIKIGSQVLDTSLRGQLRRIGIALTSG